MIFQKFCSFCSSCVLRETSIGVDYTDFEEKDCERKKEKCMFSPLHHHHLRLTTERRTIKKNFRGGFLNFIKQNYTDFEEERLREKKGIQINIRSSSGIDHREKKFFFFLNNNNNNIY